MGLYIRGKQKMERDTDMVFKYGLMELDTKVCGAIMSLQEEENSSTLMETFMMVRYLHYPININFNDRKLGE
jgi:hypothetical protein